MGEGDWGVYTDSKVNAINDIKILNSISLKCENGHITNVMIEENHILVTGQTLKGTLMPSSLKIRYEDECAWRERSDLQDMWCVEFDSYGHS